MEFCEHVQKAAMIPLFFFEKYLDLASDRYDIARLSQTHIHALSLFFSFFPTHKHIRHLICTDTDFILHYFNYKTTQTFYFHI